MSDFVQWVTEAYWEETTLGMGFMRFAVTFVVVWVACRAYVYFLGGK